MRPFGWYLLWQAPGWLVVTLVVVWLVRGAGLPVWVAVTVVALMVARDLAVYPALRSAFANPPHGATPIGATGEAVEPLAPIGYIRVNGELWRARTLRPEDGVPPGTRVLVRDARGLMLLVEPSGGPLRR
jgi:membrane protein implicated in regulation of membrane protease activity